MINDVAYNKLQVIKRKAIVLNIQRACEACIDLAMHIVSEQSLGIPQNSRDAISIN